MGGGGPTGHTDGRLGRIVYYWSLGGRGRSVLSTCQGGTYAVGAWSGESVALVWSLGKPLWEAFGFWKKGKAPTTRTLERITEGGREKGISTFLSGGSKAFSRWPPFLVENREMMFCSGWQWKLICHKGQELHSPRRSPGSEAPRATD